MNLYVDKDFEELNSSSLWYCIHRKRHVVRLTKEETIFILMLKLFEILGLKSYWMLQPNVRKFGYYLLYLPHRSNGPKPRALDGAYFNPYFKCLMWIHYL